MSRWNSCNASNWCWALSAPAWRSRKEAVRWQLVIERYITDRGYPIRTLVAFSGEVNDLESGKCSTIWTFCGDGAGPSP
jgi:hypothetical protein